MTLIFKIKNDNTEITVQSNLLPSRKEYVVLSKKRYYVKNITIDYDTDSIEVDLLKDFL